MSAVPVVCECGWEGSPRPTPHKAREALTRHRKGPACPHSPNHVPEHVREAQRRARQSQAAKKHARHLPRRTGCTALTGTCDCRTCRDADTDGGSPLDLGGTWVLRRGVRVWQPDTERTSA